MFLKQTISATTSNTHTIPYEQLHMQACYAADITQLSVVIKHDACKTTNYTQSTKNSRMGPCQKRNLMVSTHPKLALKIK